NSNLDDFAYVVNEQENKGFVSSNRSGFDRLYGFTRDENMLTRYQVEGLVQDKNSKALLEGASLTLFDEAGYVIQDYIVGEDATYLFKTEPNKTYKVRGTFKSYIPQDIEFSTDSDGGIQHTISFSLESFAEIGRAHV